MPEYKQTYSSSFSTFTSNLAPFCRKLLLLDDSLSDQFDFLQVFSWVIRPICEVGPPARAENH